jgi:hypothetical protein
MEPAYCVIRQVPDERWSPGLKDWGSDTCCMVRAIARPKGRREMSMNEWLNDDLRGRTQGTWRNSCSSATPSVTNHTFTHPVLKQRLRNEQPSPKGPIYGKVKFKIQGIIYTTYIQFKYLLHATEQRKDYKLYVFGFRDNAMLSVLRSITIRRTCQAPRLADHVSLQIMQKPIISTSSKCDKFMSPAQDYYTERVSITSKWHVQSESPYFHSILVNVTAKWAANLHRTREVPNSNLSTFIGCIDWGFISLH